jgi:membrane protein implicated in regulation of membrane protease activity
MFASFFIWWGIGGALALFWLLFKYGIPLLMLFFETIFVILKTWGSAFMEGWREAGEKDK